MFVTAVSNASTFDRAMSPAQSIDFSDPISNSVNTLRYTVFNQDNVSVPRHGPNLTFGDPNGYHNNFHHDPSSDQILHRFHEIFLPFYGYASVCVCIFGVFTNIINISVLMAKEMRTPTNNFLIALAVFDILTMLPYIPFSIHFNCPPADPITNPEIFSYSWVFFMTIVFHLMGTTHAISIWIAVSLAAFRYSQIRRPCPRGPLAHERRIRKVRIIIFIVTLVSVLRLIPSYVTQSVEAINHPYLINVTFYNGGDKGGSDTNTIDLANIIIYGTVGKIIPCILILIFSGHLIYHMSVKNIRRRQRLSTMTQQWKTTNMLLVVLILFILTELPQGILILLSVFVKGFFDDINYYLGELFDFASLLNNAINFVLYCAMSQQFRDQFADMYCKRCNGRMHRTGRSCHSEVMTMRDGNPRTTNTTTTHITEDQKTAKL